MPANLSDFGLAEMLRCSNGLRRLLKGALTMEEAARRACGYLYDELRDSRGRGACALVRCYKTHPYAQLPADLQAFADSLMGADRSSRTDLKCLTMVATRGDELEWNDRRRSRGHKAIPLMSTASVERAPMIAQMLRAFGLELADVVEPKKRLGVDLGGRTYGVFYVEDAGKSPYIPAQDFVSKYGIRSVVGFGGSLPPDDVFAVILFARIPVSASAADRFRTMALDLKGSFFSYSQTETFDQAAP